MTAARKRAAAKARRRRRKPGIEVRVDVVSSWDDNGPGFDPVIVEIKNAPRPARAVIRQAVEAGLFSQFTPLGTPAVGVNWRAITPALPEQFRGKVYVSQSL